MGKPSSLYWRGIKSSPNGGILIDLFTIWGENVAKQIDKDKVSRIDLVLHNDGSLVIFYHIFEDNYTTSRMRSRSAISSISPQTSNDYHLVDKNLIKLD